MADNKSEDALFEALILDRVLREPMSPPYGGYGSTPQRPDWWWRWPAGKKLYSSGTLATTEKDICYVNAENKYHRIHGPAYISKIYQVEEWYKNGILHRDDGPAITAKTDEFWYYEGKLHRIGGPAVVARGSPRQYWIHGQKLSPKEYKKEMERRKRKGLIK